MLLDKYNIEKRPLSKLLGFGELTITRYLEGQMPSKRYSDILLKFLEDDDLMEHQLESKKECITENAYRKVKETLSARKKLLNHTTKIEAFALYLLNSSYEITNLSLQKLLYYIKGFGYLFFGRDVLESRCEAWVHGPVFPIIYNKYKEFGKSIISIPSAVLLSRLVLSRSAPLIWLVWLLKIRPRMNIWQLSRKWLF